MPQFLSRKFLYLPLWAHLIGAIVTLLILLGVVSFGVGLFNQLSEAPTMEVIPSGHPLNAIECSESDGCRVWQPIIFTLILLVVLLTGFAYTTLLERKLIAYFQQRVGPNRVGPMGFLQPAADGIKLIFKEDIIPKDVYKAVYYISPMLKAIPTLIVVAVIPLGPPLTIPWLDGNWYRVPLHVADLNVGVMWLLAITSIGTYGITLAGWSSSNKYAMMGGLRATAQMISYELSLGLSFVVPVMLASSMSVQDIVNAQNGTPLNWFVFQNPLAAGVMMIALIAEVNRAPFDLPEAEQELTAGFMTEYSGMKFALFMMAEYLGMIAVSLIASSLFFGGYNVVLVDGAPLLGLIFTITKVVLFLIGFIWIRATLPRIRYDRLMSFGWKVMLPLALVSVVWSAVAVVIGDLFGANGYMIISGIMFVLFVAGGYYFLSAEANEEDEPDLEDDPMITGERRGLGYVALQALGGIIALPFLLYDFTLKQLDNVSQLGDKKPSDDGSSAIEKSGGD